MKPLDEAATSPASLSLHLRTADNAHVARRLTLPGASTCIRRVAEELPLSTLAPVRNVKHLRPSSDVSSKEIESLTRSSGLSQS